MKLPLLLIASFLFFQSINAQTKAQEDLKYIDSITKNAASYDVKFIINGRTLLNSYTVEKKIISYFTSLKKKSRTSQNPDVLITINISAAMLSKPNMSIRKVDLALATEADLYKFETIYTLEGSISVSHTNGSNYTIQFPKKERIAETETKVYKNPSLNSNPVDRHLSMFLEEYTQNFDKQDGLFSEHFYDMFRDYTKGKTIY